MSLTGYIDRYNFTMSDGFLRRVQTAIGNESITVIEDKTNINYSKRSQLAQSVLANPAQYAITFSFAVMSNLGFDDSSGDAALQVEVRNQWNNVAGV